MLAPHPAEQDDRVWQAPGHAQAQVEDGAGCQVARTKDSLPMTTAATTAPGTEANEAIVFRVGEGEVLVNLDGP